MKTITKYIKQERRVSAEKRTAEYQELSLDDKLAKLGEHRAEKQRKRLGGLKSEQ